MSKLREQVVRLAHENPALRPHLLPILRKHATADLQRLVAQFKAEALRDTEKSIANWRKEKQLDMVTVEKKDYRSLLKVIQLLQSGEIPAARDAADGLDTIVRDRIPQPIWNILQGKRAALTDEEEDARDDREFEDERQERMRDRAEERLATELAASFQQSPFVALVTREYADYYQSPDARKKYLARDLLMTAANAIYKVTGVPFNQIAALKIKP